MLAALVAIGFAGVSSAEAQDIPFKFLENILSELRAEGLILSRRGSDGGYWLARPANEITLAQIVRAVEGPIATVRGERPTDVEYPDSSAALRDVWVAVRASLRLVLDHVTLLDVVTGHLPDVGERFTYSALQFTVSAKEGARIDRVRVVRLKTTAKDGRGDGRAEPTSPEGRSEPAAGDARGSEPPPTVKI